MHDRDPGAATTHAPNSHGADGHVHAARTCAGDARSAKIRTAPTLSALRSAVAIEYDAALSVLGHANTTIADGYLDVSESVVRRLRSGEKPLSVGHLLLGPRDVLARVMVRAVLRAMTRTEAMALFASCMADVAKEEKK